MENTGFNQGQYSGFTPEITREHNGNVLGTLLITGLVVTAGLMIYTLVNQKMNEDKKSGL